MRKILTPYIFIAILFFVACAPKHQEAEKLILSPEIAFDSLITYIERTGDFINSPHVPAMISAGVLYSLLDSNILLIDTRTREEFAEVHIAHSANLPFNQLLNYFETKINPASFKAIALICNSGQTASYAASMLRFLGYDNVYALKFGISSWHKESAEKIWLARSSSKYTELLEREGNVKNPAGEFPGIDTEQLSGYSILRERAQMLFSQGYRPVTITVDTLFEAGQNFHIINYWPENLYNKGHIPGAIQYQPKVSLHRNQQLNTLPVDKPIVVYCFTGQHSSFVVAYLRLLGYDARTLSFGANGFMHELMKRENFPNVFTEKEIYNLPVSSGGVSSKTEAIEPVAIVPRGGC